MTVLLVPACAAISSMPTPAPCVRMARTVASTSSRRLATRWAAQRTSRPSRGVWPWSEVLEGADMSQRVSRTARTCYCPYR